MRPLPFILLTFLSVSCKQTWDIKGTWYTDSKQIGGTPIGNDPYVNYCEVYISDTVLYYRSEDPWGVTQMQKYFVKGDTILKCFYTEKGTCEFIPMYFLKKYEADTLWLTVNKAYTEVDPNIYWVRLNKGEKGHFDRVWTPENKDSLLWEVRLDYDRRKWKFKVLKNIITQEHYDSMFQKD